MKHKLTRLLLVVVAIFGIQLVTPAAASAAVYTVNTTADEDSGQSGTGAGCSLYEVARALENGTAYGGCPAPDSTGNEILLPGGTYDQTGYNGFYYGGNRGPLTVTGSTTSPTVLLGSSNRSISVYYTNNLTITNLTIRDSQSQGIYLESNQTATLTNILVDGAGNAGIEHYNAAGQATTISNVTVQNSGWAGIFHGNGGGGNGAGKLYLNNANIHGNQSTGIYNSECAYVGNFSLYITNSYIHHNGSSDLSSGGGISNACGHVSVTNSTIAHNEAERGGGISSAAGMVSQDYGNSYTPTYLDMTNVTIYGNTASEGGGGIYLWDGNSTLDHSYTWQNVTIAGNEAPGGSGIYIHDAGTAIQRPDLLNTLIANNTGSPQCASNGEVAFSSASSSNLSTDTTCGTSTSLVDGTGLLADTLTNEGTESIGFNGEVLGLAVLKLLPDSPAITGGQLCPATDSVTQGRPASNCSIGAYQFALANAGNDPSFADDGTAITAPSTGLALTTSSLTTIGGAFFIALAGLTILVRRRYDISR